MTQLTLAAFRAMTKQERVTAWRRLTVAQRRNLWQQFAATTPDYALPYPDDYNDPADTPTVLRELALATEAAINTRAAATHTHLPNSVGLATRSVDFGTVQPGEVKTSIVFGKAAQTLIFVTVQHPSTYLFAVANTTDANGTQYQISVRNSAQSTAMSNVKVNVLHVAAG